MTRHGRSPRLAGLFCLASIIAGCGEDAIKLDLESYHKQVVAPLTQQEKSTVGEIKALPAQLVSKPNRADEMLNYYEGTLVPRYKAILESAERFDAKTPEVRAVNQKLVQLYRQTIDQLGKCVLALRAKDRNAFQEAQKAMAGLRFEGVRQELQSLAKQHRAVLKNAGAAQQSTRPGR